MVKRSLIFFLLGIVLLHFYFTSAQNQEPFDRSGFEEGAGKILDTTEKLKEFAEKDRLDYLGEQWKSFLLKHPVIAKVNATLMKANPLFFFFFGDDYDFSYKYFLLILFSIAFFLTFQEIFLYFSNFNGKYSYLFAFLFTLIIAHLDIIASLSELFYKGFFALLGGMLLTDYVNQGVFKWLFELVFFVILMMYLIFSGQLVRLLKKGWDKIRTKERIENLEKTQKVDEEKQNIE